MGAFLLGPPKGGPLRVRIGGTGAFWFGLGGGGGTDKKTGGAILGGGTLSSFDPGLVVVKDSPDWCW